MEVRFATTADADEILQVHLRAFPTSAEAKLVAKLVEQGYAEQSIVAIDRSVVGHVLMSRMAVRADGIEIRGLGLAPVAVVPERQGQGIGSALVETAIDAARNSEEQIIFLLGEPQFYRRFGFSAQTAKPFDSPFAGLYFQALVLGDLPPIRSGSAAYAPPFADLG